LNETICLTIKVVSAINLSHFFKQFYFGMNFDKYKVPIKTSVMLTDSIYKNLGKPVKDQKNRMPGLSRSAIEVISKCDPDQLKKIYERYSIRYLMREISAWEKLGKHEVAKVIKIIIEGRKTGA
jgi:hypothetical protein